MPTPYRGGLTRQDVAHLSQTDQIYKLSSNENPLGASPAVVEAIQAAASQIGEYPPRTDETMREALSAHYSIDAEHFVMANSGCDVLNLIARAHLTPETECIICPPTFPIYAETARQQGATLVEVPLTQPDFELDLTQVIEAMTPRTRLVYLCSPNNPTGSLVTQSQFDQLLEALPPEVFIVFDEVYFHFVTRSDQPAAREAMLAGKNVIVVHSFSKAYGLAGLRLGYGIARPEVTAKLASYKRSSFHSPLFSFEAGLAALADQSHIEQTIELTVSGRAWLTEQLQQLNVPVWPSQGNFVLFEAPVAAQEWSDALIRQGIMVRPAFGLPNHLRVSVGLPEGNQAFIEVIKDLQDQRW